PKRVLEGVYVVEGDTLKICVNKQTEGVKERPQGFSTKDKEDFRLLVFEKTQPGAKPTEGLPGFVGIAIMGEEDGKKFVINDIIAKSPAEKAGLKKEDEILKVGELEPADLKGVIDRVRQAAPGSDLTIRVRRDGQERDITVRVGVLPFQLLE